MACPTLKAMNMNNKTTALLSSVCLVLLVTGGITGGVTATTSSDDEAGDSYWNNRQARESNVTMSATVFQLLDGYQIPDPCEQAGDLLLVDWLDEGHHALLNVPEGMLYIAPANTTFGDVYIEGGLLGVEDLNFTGNLTVNSKGIAATVDGRFAKPPAELSPATNDRSAGNILIHGNYAIEGTLVTGHGLTRPATQEDVSGDLNSTLVLTGKPGTFGGSIVVRSASPGIGNLDGSCLSTGTGADGATPCSPGLLYSDQTVEYLGGDGGRGGELYVGMYDASLGRNLNWTEVFQGASIVLGDGGGGNDFLLNLGGTASLVGSGGHGARSGWIATPGYATTYDEAEPHVVAGGIGGHGGVAEPSRTHGINPEGSCQGQTDEQTKQMLDDTCTAMGYDPTWTEDLPAPVGGSSGLLSGLPSTCAGYWQTGIAPELPTVVLELTKILYSVSYTIPGVWFNPMHVQMGFCDGKAEFEIHDEGAGINLTEPTVNSQRCPDEVCLSAVNGGLIRAATAECVCLDARELGLERAFCSGTPDIHVVLPVDVAAYSGAVSNAMNYVSDLIDWLIDAGLYAVDAIIEGNNPLTGEDGGDDTQGNQFKTHCPVYPKKESPPSSFDGPSADAILYGGPNIDKNYNRLFYVNAETTEAGKDGVPGDTHGLTSADGGHGGPGLVQGGKGGNALSYGCDGGPGGDGTSGQDAGKGGTVGAQQCDTREYTVGTSSTVTETTLIQFEFSAEFQTKVWVEYENQLQIRANAGLDVSLLSVQAEAMKTAIDKVGAEWTTTYGGSYGETHGIVKTETTTTSVTYVVESCSPRVSYASVGMIGGAAGNGGGGGSGGTAAATGGNGGDGGFRGGDGGTAKAVGGDGKEGGHAGDGGTGGSGCPGTAEQPGGTGGAPGGAGGATATGGTGGRSMLGSSPLNAGVPGATDGASPTGAPVPGNPSIVTGKAGNPGGGGQSLCEAALAIGDVFVGQGHCMDGACDRLV
jgi:hypothetical protein